MRRNRRRNTFCTMSTLNNVAPSTSGLKSTECFKFRRPMYSVNYDCLDSIGLSDNDVVKCSGAAITSPWEILKCERARDAAFTSPAVPLSEIANTSTQTSCKDSELNKDFKKFLQRMVVDDDESRKESTERFVLHIADEEHGKKYNIPVNGFKKIIDVKTDMYACTDIKVSQQLWSGWPDSCISDDLMLSQLGLTEPILDLSFRVAPVPASSNPYVEKDTNKSMEVDVYSSDEDEYYTDLIMGTDDSGFILGDDSEEPQVNSVIDSLIPQDFDDEAAASMQFTVSFEEKYGKLHPDFFSGTFKDASNEAIHKSAPKRKLLTVYLHHNRSILSNIFCSQLLCTELVVQYLSEHFILWGWDVSLESNKTRFLRSLENFLGSARANIIVHLNDLKIDKYPVIMVIRGNPQKISFIYGNVDLDELLSRLIEIVEECDEMEETSVDNEVKDTEGTQVSKVAEPSNVENAPVAGPSRISKQETDASDPEC